MRRIFLIFLFSFFLGLAFLQPLHQVPWTSALNDGLALIAGFWFIINGIKKCDNHRIGLKTVDILIVSILIFSLWVLGIEWVASASPILIILSVSTAFVCYKLSQETPGAVVALALSLWVSACVTAIIGLMILFLSHLANFSWVPPFSTDGRWGGLLNQPNNTGTLLVMAVVGSAFLVNYLNDLRFPHVLQNLGKSLIFIFALCLGLTAVLVQSRTTGLNFLLVMLVTLVGRNYLSRASFLLLALASSTYFLGLWLLPQSELLSSFFVDDPFGGRGLNSNLRFEVWNDLLGALWQHPWVGYGIGGTVHAFLAIENPSVVYGTYFVHAHNIVLELLLWFGIPLGSLLAVVFFRSLRRIAVNVNERTLLPAMMLMVLMVHAMLELPLHYAYFLIPMAIIWGWLSAQLPARYQTKPVFTVSARWFSGVGLLVLVPLFYVVSVTYLHHEQSLRQAKLEMAIKGWAAPAEPPPFPVLGELQDLNEFVRAKNDERYPPEQLQRFHDALSVYPAKSMIKKGIYVFEHNGLVDRVTYWQHKGCLIYGGDFCEKRK